MRGTMESRVGPIVLRSDGTRADLIKIDRTDLVIRMQGHETFRYAVDLMADSTVEAVGLAGLELDDVDLFVYHQANARILRAVGERLGLDARAGWSTRSPSSATPRRRRSRWRSPRRSAAGTLRRGARVLLGAFGAGLSWGATVIEWGGAVSVGV